MKTIKVLIVATLALFINADINAYGDLKIKPLSLESKTFVVEFDYSQSTDVVLRIYDKNGKELMNEVLKDVVKDVKKINLKNLPEGNYEFIIEDKLKKEIRPFELGRTLVSFKEQEREYFNPMIDQDGDFIILNFLAFAGHKVNVRINDAEGNRIYSSTIDANGSVNKAYNIEELSEGNYTFVISNDEIFHTYEFNVVH
ncbi:MAG: hypothetical protein HKN09_01205 [Saprospiraceae bacterium]|nr:hypothetical protein [Saprospiraceae bacterium]